jgi:transketolase
MDASLNWPHPIYIRLGKGSDPVISKASQPFIIGKAIMTVENQNPDILLISTGILTAEAIEASKRALEYDIKCDVMHMHTLKPLDEQSIIERIKTVKTVITIEEHSLIGGLGSAVSDCIIANSERHIPKIVRMGIQDKFVANYGVQLELLKAQGLLADDILNNIKLNSGMGIAQ